VGFQAERWAIRKHQPSDRRGDTRQGIAGRAPSTTALLARHPEWGESNGHVGGTPGPRAEK